MSSADPSQTTASTTAPPQSTTGSQDSPSDGPPIGLIVGILVLVVAVLGIAAAVLARKSRQSAGHLDDLKGESANPRRAAGSGSTGPAPWEFRPRSEGQEAAIKEEGLPVNPPIIRRATRVRLPWEVPDYEPRYTNGQGERLNTAIEPAK